MKANAVPLLALFEKKMRLEVPLFQRQYVWNRVQQWEPLWEDIARKFSEFLEGRKDAPVHFLGAMVLDQKQVPATHVEKRQVIDGQQRLTTFQIFLSAFRDFCRSHECEELAKEFDGFTANKGMMVNPDVDRFKVWPTQADRTQFSDVVSLGSRDAIEAKYPLIKLKYARTPEPRPKMVEAYLFFSEELTKFFIGTEQDPPIAADQPLALRIEETFQALKNALQVVAIDLEQGDDAQVIFETLNARGEPLLPADLLRNYIFLRAARLNEPQEELYDQYWRGFDDDFWRQEVRQGRLQRPRSDLFMQHFLASRQMVDIPIKHLFMEYKYWIERTRPFSTVTEELATLARQRDQFRRIVNPQKDDVIFDLATFLDSFDIRTAYPLLLFLMDAGLSGTEWAGIAKLLESYLLRRAVVGWTTKSYNKIFLSLTKTLRKATPSAVALEAALLELSGESSGWPTDSLFQRAWEERPAYDELNNSRIVFILSRLNEEFFNHRNERLVIDSPLTVEHILPQKWIEHWPLDAGQRGLLDKELASADAEEPRAKQTIERNAAVQTFGNLTILTQELNSTVSNSSWEVKKPQLLLSSLLPINQWLHSRGAWDELEIAARSKLLFDKAVKIWSYPKKSNQ